MQGTVTARSPAKLNLHLEVQSKRDDGYHSIISIFQMIGLYDELFCRSLKNTQACRISGMPDVPIEENIIYRAFTVFRRKTGIRAGVSFEVKKNIPKQSGLGGGSSNGAYALRMLNHLFQTGLLPEELREMAAELGSDVPFFCGGPCALVTGRGEYIQPVRGRSDLYGVVVLPGFSVSTRLAYGEFDKRGPVYQSLPPEEAVRRYQEEEPEKWGFFNAFRPVIEEQFPVIGKITDALRDFGAEYAAMSGSGSACYGIFRKKENAERALHACTGRLGNCWLVYLLDKSPDTVLQ